MLSPCSVCPLGQPHDTSNSRGAHLTTHGLSYLDSHVAQTPQSNNTKLCARLVQPIVHEGAVGGDASTQQGR